MNRGGRGRKKGRPTSQPQPQASTSRRGGRRTQTSQDSDDDEEPQTPPTRGTASKRNQKQSRISDFYEDGTQEAAGPSQKVSKVPPMSEEQVEEQARNVVFYMVSCTRDGSCVNRGDVQKNILKNFHSKHYPTVMAKAARIMNEVFGLKIQNLEGDDDKFDKMILIDGQNIPKYASSEEDKATMTLLLLIVNCIQVAGEPLKEEQLVNFLRELNIAYSKNDPNFGDVEGKLNTFKSQAYLRFETDKSTNPPSKLIALGPRALAETNKLEMMSFSKRLYPDLAFLSENSPDKSICDSEEERSDSESDD